MVPAIGDGMTKADRIATKLVKLWVQATKDRATRSVINDPDLRLVPMTYDVPGMGTKVETMRTGHLVAWFDDRQAAVAAIMAATR
jgi:hypothetical protein